MRKKIVDFYNKHSATFNIVSLLIGIGGICLTIWVSQQPVTLPQKELSCVTTSSRSLVLMLNNDSNLKLLYGDREVSNPCMTSIVIQNTGAYPIKNTDFSRPLSIIFGETDEILSINIGDCSNQHIREEVVENSDFSNQQLTINSFLLNSGEMFTIDIISDGGIPLIRFDQRLEGISDLNLVDKPTSLVFRVRKKEPAEIFPSTVILGLAAAIIIAIVAIVSSIQKMNKHDKLMFDRFEDSLQQEIYKDNEHD